MHFAMATITRPGIEMTAVETRRDLRRSEETRARFWHVATVSLFFVAVIGSGLFLGAVMVMGTLRGDESNEPAATSRTGRVARSLPDGKHCHYVIFDNKTANAIEDRIGRCDEDKPKPKKERPEAFSWGK
jgi:hypothetical protein